MRSLWPAASDDLSAAELDEFYGWPDRPWVRSNMVESVDGAAHSPGGGTRTLSSDADRRVMVTIRALADAILIGAGTARLEDYKALRPREAYVEQRAAHGQNETAALVIVSRSLDLDPSSALFAHAATRTVVITTESSDATQRSVLAGVADVLTCGTVDVDLVLAVRTLNERGLSRLVVEGGPSLLGAMLRADLVDDMAVTIAPYVVGDYTSGPAHRIVSGTLGTNARQLRLAHLLTEDDALFARYEVVR